MGAEPDHTLPGVATGLGWVQLPPISAEPGSAPLIILPAAPPWQAWSFCHSAPLRVAGSCPALPPLLCANFVFSSQSLYRVTPRAYAEPRLDLLSAVCYAHFYTSPTSAEQHGVQPRPGCFGSCLGGPRPPISNKQALSAASHFQMGQSVGPGWGPRICQLSMV